MANPVPADGQFIDTLIDSYGHIWGCEPPMYDCSLEVVSKEVSADRALAVIEQTTINLDDAEELFAGEDLTGAIWTFVVEMKWDEPSGDWKWHYNDTQPDDRQILLSEVEDVDFCLQAIFDQFNWDSYLDTYEMTSEQVMEKLPEKYQKFYEPHHQSFLKTHNAGLDELIIPKSNDPSIKQRILLNDEIFWESKGWAYKLPHTNLPSHWEKEISGTVVWAYICELKGQYGRYTFQRRSEAISDRWKGRR
jgi:hypothetical protein